MRRAVTLAIRDHEPKSKNSISARQKVAFQTAVAAQMQSFGKRAFKSEIALEISFSCQEPNPPLIHTLAKNYLDLLGKPVRESGIKRECLLYQDDSQIKTLIVNYTVGSPFKFFHIVIRALPMRDFLAEFELLGRIQRNDFAEGNSHCGFDHDRLWDELRESLGYDVKDAQATIRWMENARSKYVEEGREKQYEDMLSFWHSHLQRCVLRASQLNLERSLLLFPTYSGRAITNSSSSNWMRDLQSKAREYVVGRMFSIDLKEWPRQSGQSTAFKARIDRELDNFKAEFPYLVKLKTLLSLTILFVAPRGGQVDADNIARIIVPKVNSFFKPPSQLLIRSEDRKQLKKLRIPEHSVVRYEVIELPRSKNDPDEGFVRLIFGDGFDNRGIWSAMDNVIRDWTDSVQREY